jgi:hypothetical protein
MFSLCIPTMNRYDTYLHKFIIQYLQMDIIDEIVICDENGEDVKKIQRDFPNNNKLRLFVNERKLGPFLNKIKVCQQAKNEWIALIDSDNFADVDYFEKIKSFIENNKLNKNSILSPDYGTEIFRWEHLSSYMGNHAVLNRKTYLTLKQLDQKRKQGLGNINHLVNTGNYVLNKYLIDNINLQNDMPLINISYCFDVLLMNLLMFEQLDLQFYILKDLKYKHAISDDSIYTRTAGQLINGVPRREYANMTYKRLYNYLS